MDVTITFLSLANSCTRGRCSRFIVGIYFSILIYLLWSEPYHFFILAAIHYFSRVTQGPLSQCTLQLLCHPLQWTNLPDTSEVILSPKRQLQVRRGVAACYSVQTNNSDKEERLFTPWGEPVHTEECRSISGNYVVSPGSHTVRGSSSNDPRYRGQEMDDAWRCSHQLPRYWSVTWLMKA